MNEENFILNLLRVRRRQFYVNIQHKRFVNEYLTSIVDEGAVTDCNI